VTEVRTYEVRIELYTPALYCARSPAKARARAYREFCSCHEVTFHNFLCRSSIRRVANPPGVGERIMVSGLPATRVLPLHSHYVWFMRDGADQVLCSHPADVSTVPNGEQKSENAGQNESERQKR
jgi:hypothetical protein